MPGTTIMSTHHPDEVPVWSGEMNYDEKYTGTLYLTKTRLFFERKVGIFSRKNNLVADIPLKVITSASIEKGPWDWTVLVIVAGGQKHRFLFRAKNPDELIKRVGELMEGQKP